MSEFVFIVIMISIFWLFEFIQLMLLKDNHLPGKYDKILWVVVFVIFPFIAPIAFFIFQRSYKEYLDKGNLK